MEKVKNDPEKHRQMMLEFQTKTAGMKSKLLNFCGKEVVCKNEFSQNL